MKRSDYIALKENRLTNVQKSEYLDLVIMTGINSDGNLTLNIWRGRQSKSYINYFYSPQNESRLIDCALQAMKNAEEIAAYNAEKKAARAAYTPVIEKGDVFTMSYGYNQTNVHFFEVVEKASKHFAIVREIELEFTNDELTRVMPQLGAYKESSSFLGGIAEKKLKVSESGISLERGYNAKRWDGRAEHQTSPYERH